MNESQIPVRYAKALFESASGQQILDAVYADMKLLFDTCSLEGFRYMLVLPSLQPSQKQKVVEALFKERFTPVSMALISLVITNKRESYLQGIARRFQDLYRQARGIQSARLVTAQPVDEPTLKKIRELIGKSEGSAVDLAVQVDQDLIGGFVLTVEGLQYDASVSASLRRIRKQLLQTSVQKK